MERRIFCVSDASRYNAPIQNCGKALRKPLSATPDSISCPPAPPDLLHGSTCTTFATSNFHFSEREER
ncbi:Hypothetical protein NTJ_02033 [Nesidiocoris tenuis]|uniref:Sema domain-containing protein n=1 Tax=Nesidiocoris tenuis TaxID=355587 RepID=A0ABN7AA99_9HEMI|nr:Hypothetical protein NTJ_02033 [Nesidiocoris tenuis]